MVKTDRKRIGFLMNNDDLGVVYYLGNIVQSLNYLVDSKKPCIVLFYDKSTEKHTDIFSGYPHVEFHLLKYPSTIVLYLKSIIRRKNYFINHLLHDYQLDGIMPVNDMIFKNSVEGKKTIAWITDFQHKFYPHFFSVFNRIIREFRFSNSLRNANYVILSSQDAKTHLLQLYKKVSAELRVLHFVSFANNVDLLNINTIKQKYDIHKPYFIVSNQFYKHKNHQVVFDAIKQMLERGYTNFEVVFTGKKEDYRDKTFFQQIEKFVVDNSLQNNLKIVGVIPRNEQLTLFKMAEAAIQPSFFEGWNSSIEDAKTLRQQVVCSDIAVHHEQMQKNAFYFNPTDASALATILIGLLTNKIEHLPTFDNFEQRVNDFAMGFIRIFDEN